MDDPNQPTDSWPWPDELDAMIAAPGFHAVLFENNQVRVLGGRVPSGAVVPVHTHRWGGVLYIIGTSDFIRPRSRWQRAGGHQGIGFDTGRGHGSMGRSAYTSLIRERRNEELPVPSPWR